MHEFRNLRQQQWRPKQLNLNVNCLLMQFSCTDNIWHGLCTCSLLRAMVRTHPRTRNGGRTVNKDKMASFKIRNEFLVYWKPNSITSRPLSCSRVYIGDDTRNRGITPPATQTWIFRSFVRLSVCPFVRSSVCSLFRRTVCTKQNKKSQNGNSLWCSRR